LPTHPPEEWTATKEKDLFFGFIMPLLPVKQWQSHRRKELRLFLLGQSSNAPNPFGCSFFIKQNPTHKTSPSFYFIKNRAVVLPSIQPNFFLHLKKSDEKKGKRE